MADEITPQGKKRRLLIDGTVVDEFGKAIDKVDLTAAAPSTPGVQPQEEGWMPTIGRLGGAAAGAGLAGAFTGGVGIIPALAAGMAGSGAGSALGGYLGGSQTPGEDALVGASFPLLGVGMEGVGALASKAGAKGLGVLGTLLGATVGHPWAGKAVGAAAGGAAGKAIQTAGSLSPFAIGRNLSQALKEMEAAPSIAPESPLQLTRRLRAEHQANNGVNQVPNGAPAAAEVDSRISGLPPEGDRRVSNTGNPNGTDRRAEELLQKFGGTQKEATPAPKKLGGPDTAGLKDQPNVSLRRSTADVKEQVSRGAGAKQRSPAGDPAFEKSEQMTEELMNPMGKDSFLAQLEQSVAEASKKIARRKPSK